jgi:hypothetical protein
MVGVRATKSKPDISTAQWASRGNAVYLEGRAYLDGVDAMAMEMERKWGSDRLRLLVEPEWRAKFDSQRYKLNVAIQTGDLDDVKREAVRMSAAWRKLDVLADEAGKPHLSPEVWEIATEDGRVIAICRDGASSHLAFGDGRRVEVWHLREIANIIQKWPEIGAAKLVFPGARVVACREPTDPMRSVELDDEIPF